MDIPDLVHKWYSDPANWQSHLPDHFDEGLIDKDKMIVGCSVLNLGCFYPVTEQRFAHLANYWCAIDFSPEVIKRCCKDFPELRVRWQIQDMRHLPYADESFDTVLDYSSGDHLSLDDYVRTLNGIHRILGDCGYFIVSYANLDHFTDKERDVYGLYGYERRTPSSELKEILEVAGFTILRNENQTTRSGFVCQKKHRS
jgi:SAM-dependent methyltransferase